MPQSTVSSMEPDYMVRTPDGPRFFNTINEADVFCRENGCLQVLELVPVRRHPRMFTEEQRAFIEGFLDNYYDYSNDVWDGVGMYFYVASLSDENLAKKALVAIEMGATTVVQDERLDNFRRRLTSLDADAVIALVREYDAKMEHGHAEEGG